MMARLIPIVGAALLISGLLATDALAYYCSRPSEPSVPRGMYDDYEDMKSAERDVDKYLSEIRDYIDCMQNETQEAIREAENVQTKWNSAVRLFNMQ